MPKKIISATFQSLLICSIDGAQEVLKPLSNIEFEEEGFKQAGCSTDVLIMVPFVKYREFL